MASIAQNTAFGIVTVMDVKVYNLDTTLTIGGVSKSIEEWYKGKDADRAAFNKALKELAIEPLCKLDHLQVATLSTDGPSVEIQGGKFNNKLIKYGKTTRCEMTDALGQMDALVALGGAEYLDEAHPGNGIVVTDKFGGPVIMVGDSFVVDQKSGRHVPVTVILYQFLPDSTPSFAFDSGNAATFDLNGDLLAVEFLQNDGDLCGDGSGVFFALEFDTCDLDNGDFADITYGGGVEGPSKMKLGQEYQVTVPAGRTATALNLDNMTALTISENKITLPTSPAVARVLISSQAQE